MTDYAATAKQYAVDITTGKIPAGRYIKLACQRHLDDLDWQDDDTFKFRFDEKAAAHACGFVELMPHVDGKWAQEGKRLVMEPWQVFMVASIFGWKRKRDNLRRFRVAFVLVPRKNGKSTIAAPLCLYMLTADGEMGAQVYSGATSEIQAKYIFTPARKMALKSAAFCNHYGVSVNASNLHVVATGSKFEPIIGNPGDGGSPSFAAIDEYHEHPTDALYSTMETGMGAREQPLLFVITTAGDNIAGPCYAMQGEVQSMLEGTRQDDETFGLIYGIDPEDDWTDPEIIKKANPNFGVSVNEGQLLSKQKAAMESPRKAGAFKTKHLNVWVQAREAYFNVQKYIAAGDPSLKLEDFAGQECIIGVDLAEKRDLTAVELLFRHKGGYARFGRYYLPQDTIEQPENEHFKRWRDAGLLTETEGAITDEREIFEDILEWSKIFNVREIAFDPHHSRQMSILLMEQGLTCIEYGNKPIYMNEPMRAMDALIADGKFYHQGKVQNEDAFAWMLSNVVLRSQVSDLCSPAKERGRHGNKIDGPVAAMMALGRWLLDEAAPVSPWEDEEFRLEVG